MSKTEVSGKQVKDGSIEAADLSTALTNTISGKADSSSLATVATSGSYADLTNKPSLFSGSYDDLTNKPTIPSLTGYATESYVSSAISGKADSSSLASVATSGSYNDLSNKPSLFSGSYTDLTNKPTIPSALDDLSDVAVSSATKGQFVVHNGTSFVNSNTIEASGAAVKPLIIKGAASQTANLLEVTNSSDTVLTAIQSNGTVHSARYTETVANAFNTSLSPSSGTLTIDTSLGNAVLGALSASVTTWAFTNVPTDNSKITTVTAVVAGNASYTYGDACSVNGSSVTGGIMWSGGSAPTATAGTDIITFVIVKDSAGTVKVFGSGTTNFS